MHQTWLYQIKRPISSNFTSVGVNYNISNKAWSGNLSAWTIDRNGFAFNPSFSAMVFPESTTNFVRGQGFRSNNQVLKRFVANGQHQKALDYFGFDGTYDPDNPLFNGGNEPGITSKKTGEIFYNSNAFDRGFDNLYFIADHEMKHRSDVLLGKYENKKLSNVEYNKEEYNTYIYNYKRQGLYSKNSMNLGNRINMTGTAAGIKPDIFMPYCIPSMRPFWHFIYNIPRKW